jgi:hypothetical protein
MPVIQFVEVENRIQTEDDEEMNNLRNNEGKGLPLNVESRSISMIGIVQMRLLQFVEVGNGRRIGDHEEMNNRQNTGNTRCQTRLESKPNQIPGRRQNSSIEYDRCSQPVRFRRDEEEVRRVAQSDH